MSKMVVAGQIERKIHFIRGTKVMLDKDLAELYGVPTKRLNEQVKRNPKRFPNDFMFQLTMEEVRVPRSQFATLKKGKNIKYLPYAFTEQGVAMLSSVLNSDRVIEVNLQIMRVFVKLREWMMSHKDLARKIEELERKYDAQFRGVFEAIRRLMKEEEKPKAPIGFHPHR
ncbi:MAG: ORF6N domain-containing protein [Candidatus Omnitrophica bacterium]|nr:ORF6N domain-containing protein [Candidatus Omnitrophota bacterium]